MNRIDWEEYEYKKRLIRANAESAADYEEKLAELVKKLKL